MSQLQRIAELKHPGVIRDFKWTSGHPLNLKEFSRYNLVYGRNGSGKTIISRILRHLENGENLQEGQVRLKIDGNSVDGQGFSNNPIPIRVFNCDFIRDTVFRVDSKEIAPIFVLGKENVENQQELDRLRSERNSKDNDLRLAKEQLDEACRQFDIHQKNTAKLIKDTLTLQGQRGEYNNYHKTKYAKHADEILSSDDYSTAKLNSTEFEQLNVRYRSPVMEEVNIISDCLPSLGRLFDDVREICDESIMDSVRIQSLENDALLAQWIEQGLKLHRAEERQSEECLFCNQSLPPDRLDSLESHFSNEYDRLMQRIKTQIKVLDAKKKRYGKYLLTR